jgi:hypothetical protein
MQVCRRAFYIFEFLIFDFLIKEGLNAEWRGDAAAGCC